MVWGGLEWFGVVGVSSNASEAAPNVQVMQLI